MGGSTCITILLLLVVFLQTASWKVLAAVTRKRLQVGNVLRWDLEGEGPRTTQITPASLEMKEGEYKLRRKKEICLER